MGTPPTKKKNGRKARGNKDFFQGLITFSENYRGRKVRVTAGSGNHS